MQSTLKIYQAPGSAARIEAYLKHSGYSPHRHDTYTVALTMTGVQRFRYRGERRASLPGQLVLLHPDELHDGQTKDERGFRYRSIYLQPRDMQAALGGTSLPFIREGVSGDPRLVKAALPLLEDYQRELNPLAFDDGIYDFSLALAQVAGTKRRIGRANYRSAELALQYLMDNWQEDVNLDTLSRIADQDRWQLSRDFRLVFGTSPYQYLIFRRLERAQSFVLAGMTLADAAAAARFADQSHFTRHFKKANGMTPRLWLQARCSSRTNVLYPPVRTA